MPTFAFVTFGCKVNQYESQGLRESLQTKGYSEVDVQSEADLFILNTCTVTETASKEATKLVKKLHKNNPEAKITVTGCAAETHRKEFLSLNGVQSVVNHEDKHNLPQLIDTGSLPFPETSIRKRAKIRDENIFEIPTPHPEAHEGLLHFHPSHDSGFPAERQPGREEGLHGYDQKFPARTSRRRPLEAEKRGHQNRRQIHGLAALLD